jgi:hypothetical protein
MCTQNLVSILDSRTSRKPRNLFEMLDEVLEMSFGQIFNVHNKLRRLHVHNLLTHILSLCYRSVLVIPMYIVRVGGRTL